MSTTEIITIIALSSNIIIVLISSIFNKANKKSEIKSKLFFENQLSIYTDLNILLSDLYDRVVRFTSSKLDDIKRDRSKLVKILNSKRFFLIDDIKNLLFFNDTLVELIEKVEKYNLDSGVVQNVYGHVLAKTLNDINNDIFKKYSR